MAVIGVNYSGSYYNYDEDGNRTELNPPTLKYNSVYLHTRKGDFIFDSGDFIKDWHFANKKYIEICDEDPTLSASSTVDHFIMDGAKFDSAYLHIVDGTPTLVYIDTTDEYYIFTQNKLYNGLEIFVPEGTTPTWEEHKTYVTGC